MNRLDRGIAVVGFMGAGKTTTANALARRLDCTMVDLDEFVVRRSGHFVAEIIETEGEPRFRQLEADALVEVLRENAAGVIALGGGTWTYSKNRAAISGAGLISVWLDAPFELCWQRIRNSSDERPLARDEFAARALYDARRLDYASADAHIRCGSAISTDGVVTSIVNEIGLTDVLGG